MDKSSYEFEDGSNNLNDFKQKDNDFYDYFVFYIICLFIFFLLAVILACLRQYIFIWCFTKLNRRHNNVYLITNREVTVNRNVPESQQPYKRMKPPPYQHHSPSAPPYLLHSAVAPPYKQQSMSVAPPPYVHVSLVQPMPPQQI